MKIISNALAVGLFGLLLSATGHAEEKAAKKGFVRLVNAVAAGTGILEMKVDSTPLNPKGYNFGDVTGGVPLGLGSHEITIKREGVKEGKTKIVVGPDETTILIPFAEMVPASDTEPAHWEVRVLRLKQLEPESERSATFVSVSQHPELRVDIADPDGKWNMVTVKRLAVTQAPIHYPRGYVPLKLNDEKLEPIPVSEMGNYVVLLYDDIDGKTLALNFRDYKFLSAD
jgi:hypothetical protein